MYGTALRRKSEDMLQLRREGGRWLRDLREAAGLSQRQLAERVGAEYYTFISQLETGRGRIPPDRYRDWAAAFDADPRDFVRELLRYYDPVTHEILFELRAHLIGGACRSPGRRTGGPETASGRPDQSFPPHPAHGDRQQSAGRSRPAGSSTPEQREMKSFKGRAQARSAGANPSAPGAARRQYQANSRRDFPGAPRLLPRHASPDCGMCATIAGCRFHPHPTRSTT